MRVLEAVISHDCQAGWRVTVTGLSRPCWCRTQPLEARDRVFQSAGSWPRV